MILVGIDVASNKHDIFIMNALGEVFNKHFTIDNTRQGYKKLLEQISLAKEFFKDSNVRIGLESTGHYSRNILYFLILEGYDVMFINPLLTNMDRKASSVRKTKTDSIDAKAICMFLIRNQNDFKPYTLSSYHIDELKILVRQRKSLKKQLNQITNQLHAFLDQAFPEYHTVFKNILSNAPLTLLSSYASLSELKRVRVNTLSELLKKSSKGRHGLAKVELIKTLVKDSIGIDSASLSLSIKQSVQTIRTIESQIDQINQLLEHHITESKTTLLSIPGIGTQTGAIILAEIGDINRFKSDDALLAYAGLDPSVYQSGNYEGSFKISKRGSSILRWAIFQAAKVAVIHDPVFNAYYEKKKSEGKHYLTIIGHVTKKLLRVIRSILKNNSVYTVSH
ncbi:IS110 family transposase [Acholeplasma hippikon]|uniref:Transposase IS116/IS110/IS902 family n=1 Tax=Acholeplasma hippikon TaxID=264636 RepID=A0A449BIH8_9MOLU|nr:IS110 family transposase [Acholeplasma hippikon]VEU82238.1 Transposase IS116/IS110/IS902 family [Acholeplasma hippikon]